MNIITIIDIHILSLLILLILLIIVRQQSCIYEIQHKYFQQLVLFNMCTLFFEMFGWIIDGISGPGFRIFIFAIDSIFLLTNNLFIGYMVRYFDFYVFNDNKGLKKRFPLYMIPTIFFGVLLVINIKTRLIFDLNENNVYVRGPYFFILTILLCGMWAIGISLTIYTRKKVSTQEWIALLLFNLIPFTAGLVQAFIYGIPAFWPSISLAILVLFLYVEMKHLQQDHLTGISNRRKFDSYLEYRLKQIRPFTLLMIDLDGFKVINDNFGHDTGDFVLVESAKLLDSAISRRDFVARFAGDEFIAVIDTVQQEVIESVVDRIRYLFADFNWEKHIKHKVTLSIGYEIVYNPLLSSYNKILQSADASMYTEKIKSSYIQKTKL